MQRCPYQRNIATFLLKEGHNSHFKFKDGFIINQDISQQTRHVDLRRFHCCANVADGGPALERHWVNVLCLLGCHYSLWFVVGLYISIDVRF